MRIKLDIPLRLDIDAKLLPEFHDLFIKARDAAKDDSLSVHVWNQFIEQIEDKLEYLKIRPAFVEETQQQITDRRDEILRKIQQENEQQQPQK